MGRSASCWSRTASDSFPTSADGAGIDAARAANKGDGWGAALRHRQALAKHRRLVDDEKLEGRLPAPLPVHARGKYDWFEWEGMVSGDALQELLPFRANAILW